jgi:hypothetical protein
VADCCFNCGSYRKHHVLSPVMIRLRNVPFLSALSIRSLQMLMRSVTLALLQDMWNNVLGNTRHVHVIRQNFVQVPWLIPAAAILCTVWEQLAHTGIATSWILSSVLTVLGQPVCSSSSKLSLPCAKCLCHLNTAVRPKDETFR